MKKTRLFIGIIVAGVIASGVIFLSSSNEPNCDPSYPDFCIPSYSADLDCDEIPHTNFRVIQPDPHGFDRDNDGIGCES